MTNPNKRLEALRHELSRQGLDAFLIPRSDAHQSEYVAPSDERLRYISGFSGSAGLAAVTADKAALFVDGRYTLQAARQSPSPVWEQRHITDAPLAGWLAGVLAAEARIGFDPTLHRKAEIDNLSNELAARGMTLVASASNAVDAIWNDRPAPPTGKVMLQPVEYAGETSANKRGRLAEKLSRANQDALLISAPDNLCWLFNIRGSDVAMNPVVLGFAVVKADGTAELFLDPAKLDPETRASLTSGGDVTLSPPEALSSSIKMLKGARLLLDQATGSRFLFDQAEQAGAIPTVSADPITLMKSRKNSAELDGMRRAQIRDGAAITRFLAWVDSGAAIGMTEWEVAEKLYALRRDLEHFQGSSFSTISATAGNAAEAHYQMTRESAATLTEGDLFLCDSGAQYLDGTTDITRVMALGTPTNEMRRRYTQVLKGHVALSRQRFPKGTTGARLDPFARQFLWHDGVDFDHGTGHGVGCYLSVHEGPQSISPRGTATGLLPGMIVSNEPGYYKPGAFGIRIENLVIVREARNPPADAERPLCEFETITFAPYERCLINTEMLSDNETHWINAYHAETRKKLAPLLDAGDLEYLIKTTEPL